MEWLKITSKTEMFRVSFNDIAYIEAQGDYSVIHLINGNAHTFTLQLKKFDQRLCGRSDYGFVRLGRSFIINKKYVVDINVRDCQLILGSGRFSNELNVQRKCSPLENASDSRPSKDALRELKSVMEKEKEGVRK